MVSCDLTFIVVVHFSCWLSTERGFIWAFVGPACAIICVCIVRIITLSIDHLLRCCLLVKYYHGNCLWNTEMVPLQLQHMPFLVLGMVGIGPIHFQVGHRMRQQILVLGCILCVSVCWVHAWALQKRLNRSWCHSIGCLGGVKVGRIHSPSPGVTRWRCGFLSKLFDHLFDVYFVFGLVPSDWLCKTFLKLLKVLEVTCYRFVSSGT